ncbi:MAG: tetratricopeptide repeat protein [Bacteroidota bacterium]
MKKTIVAFIGLFISFSFNVFSQERKDESRQKVDFVVESKSDKLSTATGWTRVEIPTGKVWKQSEKSVGYNYQESRLRAYSFQNLKVFELSSEGRVFYALAVKRPIFGKYDDSDGTSFAPDTLLIIASKVDYFFFTESSMKRFRNIGNAADGKTYTVAAVKYYKTASPDKNWYNQEIAMKDKELKAIFQTSKGTIENWGNRCEGDSLLVINSQILKGDTIVRFNLLSDIASDSKSIFNLLPLDNSYFEVTKSEFNRLFKFTPYITKENMQRASDFVNSGTEKDKQKDYKGAISDYSKALEIDPDNAEAYCKRGLSKKELRDYPGAIADCSRAIEIETEGSYYNARGLCEIESGQKESGCLDFKKAVELGYKKAKQASKENCE